MNKLSVDYGQNTSVALTNKVFKMKGREMNSKSILELYMLIQQVIERDCISLVLSNKTEAQINGKLTQLIKEKIFKRVWDNQLFTLRKVNHLTVCKCIDIISICICPFGAAW